MVKTLSSILCILSFLAGCSSAPRTVVPPAWNFEQGAIDLNLDSTSQLNLFQKNPHSLLVCLYLLKDPTAFNQVVGEQDGLVKLLQCTPFDQTVTYSRRLVLQPSQSLHEQLDRSDGARFVGVVAGYYNLHRETSVRSFAIPLTEMEQGSQLVQRPARLAIDLTLGAQQIETGTTSSTP
ncbi:hypothetical protein GMLC_04840 [Geomonas limicola]|uniref:Type VI secretion system-associated lipoprotein n=1 Tax=Geomonas limicola TaxID=2740186 RepID=A0A6V8N2X7_9BACT|nr:type VI secretion system lipoprotein TssJ [Geomonas limicola]GFO66905.1 hypothetical protein GMLC_04840 [Geomonas limicola]